MGEEIDDGAGLRELVDQIRRASASGLYYLALFGVLALPDIAGALSTNGKSSGAKYRAWLEEWVPSKANDARQIYKLRCSLIHRGSAFPQGADQLPVIFTIEGTSQVHGMSIATAAGDRAMMSVPLLIDEICTGVDHWLDAHLASNTVQRNIAKYARLRPNGLAPWIGIPVVA